MLVSLLSLAFASEPAVWDWSEPRSYYVEVSQTVPSMPRLGRVDEASGHTHWVRVVQSQLRTVLSCEGAPTRRGWTVTCTVDDLAAAVKGRPGEDASFVGESLESRWTGEELVLHLRADGRIRRVDADENEVASLVQVAEALSLQLAEGESWDQSAIDLAVPSGALASVELTTEAHRDGESVALETRGDGRVGASHGVVFASESRVEAGVLEQRHWEVVEFSERQPEAARFVQCGRLERIDEPVDVGESGGWEHAVEREDGVAEGGS